MRASRLFQSSYRSARGYHHSVPSRSSRHIRPSTQLLKRYQGTLVWDTTKKRWAGRMLQYECPAAAVAQLVVAPDCGSGCRGFKSHQPPQAQATKPATFSRFLTTQFTSCKL